ncbi:MAG: radical SAM protein [Deltaproteobacteria bacterium]|nr:radical SAM protein [Deltaproteobacteria bacterium]
MDDLLKKAREMSWDAFGREITFYLPGMFRCDGVSGKYPAISITGTACALSCDHCKGTLLESMISAPTPALLMEKCIFLAEKGSHGVLISGGCDQDGRLPWNRFIPAIREIKKQTGLFVSVHCGLLDDQTARDLKNAGVDQALIDVIGDDETYRSVYHVTFGVSRIASTLGSLQKAGLPVTPHIVCGLHYGRIRGEYKAVHMISRFDAEQVVIVSYMKTPGAEVSKFVLPEPEEVAGIIARTRLHMPEVRISMGCARERGNTLLETLAIDAGVNRMAIPSDEAIQRAMDYGLAIKYQRTCCSVSRDLSGPEW